MKGKVKFFNEEKGFGFITTEEGKDVFVHLSGIKNNEVLQDEDDVTFDVVEGDRGPKAENVTKGGADEAPAAEAPADDSGDDAADGGDEESAADDDADADDEETPAA